MSSILQNMIYHTTYTGISSLFEMNKKNEKPLNFEHLNKNNDFWQLLNKVSEIDITRSYTNIRPFLARLFIKTEEVLSPPARRRRRRRQCRRLRPVKFWGKLLRQKIMLSSFISSLAQNLFIFAGLIHKVVLINNQALINIHMYYFSHFFHVFGNVSTYVENICVGKLLRQKIMSSFISSSTQNLFKFAILLHCITCINIWVLSSWYNL